MNQMQVTDAFGWGWLARAAGSTVVVWIDQFRGNPEATAMKWDWVLITLCMGLLGYVLTDKELAPGTHEEFVKSLWTQRRIDRARVASNATEIIATAAITATVGRRCRAIRQVRRRSRPARRCARRPAARRGRR